MPKGKVLKTTINANGSEITIMTKGDGIDYICITDIAKYKHKTEAFSVINNWMRNRSTIEFLGLWEKLNNPNFKPIEFERFKNESGLMTEFELWLKENEDKLHPIEFAALAHKKFVFIHPFIDGNGRVARLLMNLCLIRKGYTIAIIPPVLRNEYIILRKTIYWITVTLFYLKSLLAVLSKRHSPLRLYQRHLDGRIIICLVSILKT